MKVEVLGVKSREYVKKETGERRVYTDLYFQQNFTEVESKEGSRGKKCGGISTTIDCTGVMPGDIINLDYGPTGYKNQDGSDQIRLLGIDIIQQKAK